MSRIHLSNKVPLTDFIVESIPAAASAFFEDVVDCVFVRGDVLERGGECGSGGSGKEENKGICEFHDGSDRLI